MKNPLYQATLAELVGTFILVFVGGFAVVVAPINGVIVPALGHGLILVGIIGMFGHISGAQLNPAVTLGLLVGNKIEVNKAAFFIGAQLIGGIIAAVLIVLMMPDGAQVALLGDTASFNFGQTVGVLTDDYVWTAAAIEAVLTFFLVSAVYQAAVYGKAGSLAGVVIGFTLAASILAGGNLTGASLNPARTLGPALMAGELDYVIPYFIGTIGGGVIAGLLHARVFYEEKM